MTMRRISDRRADNGHAKIGSENPSADDDHSIKAHENFHFINPDTSMSPNLPGKFISASTALISRARGVKGEHDASLRKHHR